MHVGHIDWSWLPLFVGIGFGAQIVDGALGMAFGVISNTLLISLGVPPAAASAGVHTVESFTTAASAISHVLHQNVDWRLFARLLIPGILGGVCGAYLLASVDAAAAKPFVLAYLAAIGFYLLLRGIFYAPAEKKPKMVAPLGLVGGFLDASGGGGWGPIVTSNLLVQGAAPRTVIGTVSAVEFFLTITISATFIAHLGLASFTVATLGLLIGGIVAAPFGAYFAKRISTRTLLILVGVILLVTSACALTSALRSPPSNPAIQTAGVAAAPAQLQPHQIRNKRESYVRSA
jgi:uncharacterized membrane protein YfcA